MGTEHSLQRFCGHFAVGSTRDRVAPDEADHLRRLVHHPGALGDGQRQRAILPDKHFEAARTAALC